MFYYVYQLTCKVNGKIYIGCHRTKRLDDGYMGSGRRLSYAKRKYGIEAFEKTILSFHETAEEMLAEEIRLVNVEFLERTDVYNLQPGGGGGFSAWHKENAVAFHKAGKLAMEASLTQEQKRKRASHGWKNRTEKQLNAVNENLKLATQAAASSKANLKRKATLAARGHSQGEKNSQFGTCWVTNGTKPIKVKKDQLDEYLARGYSKGRKLS